MIKAKKETTKAKLKSKTEEVTKASKKDLSVIKKVTEKLINFLGIENAKIKVLKDKEETINVNIDCEDVGVLIGNRGETISSLQLIISLIVYNKLGHWQRMIVNVGDYREKREESLSKLAINTAQKVKFSGKEVILPNLNPSERRIIHLNLKDSPDVVTESQGEGRDRILLVKPKK
ncbi:protein jag [Patescibacteria group bacterium]